MIVCRRCGARNRDSAHFCGHCAAPLAGSAACPVCGAPNRAGARFCQTCGQPVGGLSIASGQTGLLPAQSLLRGRYRILARIAQGGQGAVYKATDLLDQSLKAVKEMSLLSLPPDERGDAIAAFQREAQLLATLQHPNLPRVSDLFGESERLYLVIEFVDGQTLERALRTRPGGVPESEVCGWARQLCDVLIYLHAQQPPIVYRDMKPSNVMLRPDGVIKLIDFGIARFHKAGQQRDTQLIGTPGFAPPEQYGQGQTDARSDVYALGATLHCLLTGSDPGMNPFNLPRARDLVPAVSVRVSDALFTATRPRPEDRHPTMRDMRRALLGDAAAPPPARPGIVVPPAAVEIACPGCGSPQPLGQLCCADCGEYLLDLDGTYTFVCPECGEYDESFCIPEFGEPVCENCSHEFSLDELAAMRYGDLAGERDFGCPDCGQQHLGDFLVPDLGLARCEGCGTPYPPGELAALSNGALAGSGRRFVCPKCQARDDDWVIPEYGAAVCANCGEIFSPDRLATLRRR